MVYSRPLKQLFYSPRKQLTKPSERGLTQSVGGLKTSTQHRRFAFFPSFKKSKTFELIIITIIIYKPQTHSPH